MYCYTSNDNLYSYLTGEYLRAATTAEVAASDAAALRDGGRGVILVYGLER